MHPTTVFNVRRTPCVIAWRVMCVIRCRVTCVIAWRVTCGFTIMHVIWMSVSRIQYVNVHGGRSHSTIPTRSADVTQIAARRL